MPKRKDDGLDLKKMAADTIPPLLEALSRDVRELSLGTEVQRVKGPLHPLQFLRDFVMLNRPCIITDAITHWPALKLWSNQYLCSKLAHQDVSCHFTPDGRADALVNMIADEKVVLAEGRREARGVHSCGASASTEPLKVKRGGRPLFSCGMSGEAEPLTVESGDTRRLFRRESEEEGAVSVCAIHGENLEAGSPSVGQGREERGEEEVDYMQVERETSQGSNNEKLVPVMSHSGRDVGASQVRDCIMDESKEYEIRRRGSVRNLEITDEMDLTAGKGHSHGAVFSQQQDDTDEEEESEKSAASEDASVSSTDEEGEDDEEESDDESGVEEEKELEDEDCWGESEGGEEESDLSDTRKEDVVFASALVETLPFRKALDYIIGANNDLGVAYMQQQNNCFVSEFSLLSSDADLHISWASEALGCAPEAVNLWIGGKESVTSFHKDHYENLYAVVAGEKHFTLLPPTDVHRMYVRDYPSAQYVRTDSGELKLEKDDSTSTVPWVSVDPFPKPTELEKARSSFPRYFEGPNPFVCTVRAGELLYLPSLWFHHVSQTPDSEGRTIALNYWYDMQFEMKYAYSNLVQSLAATL